MNYYLSLLDRLERGVDENRSIGIILCAEKETVWKWSLPLKTWASR